METLRKEGYPCKEKVSDVLNTGCFIGCGCLVTPLWAVAKLIESLADRTDNWRNKEFIEWDYKRIKIEREIDAILQNLSQIAREAGQFKTSSYVTEEITNSTATAKNYQFGGILPLAPVITYKRIVSRDIPYEGPSTPMISERTEIIVRDGTRYHRGNRDWLELDWRARLRSGQPEEYREQHSYCSNGVLPDYFLYQRLGPLDELEKLRGLLRQSLPLNADTQPE